MTLLLREDKCGLRGESSQFRAQAALQAGLQLTHNLEKEGCAYLVPSTRGKSASQMGYRTPRIKREKDYSLCAFSKGLGVSKTQEQIIEGFPGTMHSGGSDLRAKSIT